MQFLMNTVKFSSALHPSNAPRFSEGGPAVLGHSSNCNNVRFHIGHPLFLLPFPYQGGSLLQKLPPQSLPQTSSPPPPPKEVLSTVSPFPSAPQLLSSHVNYRDSVDSSPCSQNNDSWGGSVPPAPASTKIRFMCSFGGHIILRQHDKSLCYVGGETRIIVVERHASLSDLSSHLSKSFLKGFPFTLKYKLPTDDLDSLISVLIDEDLDNLIDEYDIIYNSSPKPSRIRLFLFPAKPNLTQSIPIINSSVKSEDVGSGSSENGKSMKQQGQDVYSESNAHMMETTSSSGSSSSSPLVTNFLMSSPPTIPTPHPQIVPLPRIVHKQLQRKIARGVDLPSPDSVSSSMTNAMSRPKPIVYQDQAQLQIPTGSTRVPSNTVDMKLTMSTSHGQIQMQQQVLEQGDVLRQQFNQQQQQHHQFIHRTQQQVQEAGYVLQPQFEQQQQNQFINNTHFLHPTFYPVYPSQLQLHPQHHHQHEQKYRFYYEPTIHTQTYNLSTQQPNMRESVHSSHAHTTQNPVGVPSFAPYNPIGNAPLPKSEMRVGAYGTTISVTPQVVQVAFGQPQQQFDTYSHYQHPSQAIAPNSATQANYAYEYIDPTRAQIYLSQPPALIMHP